MEGSAKVILWSLFILFVIFFIWATYTPVYDNFFASLDCSEKKRDMELSFNGIIRRKYIDSGEHCFRMVSILIDNRITYDFHVIGDRDSSLWLKTKINDSISKQVNTTRFLVYRKGIADTLDIYYPCDN